MSNYSLDIKDYKALVRRRWLSLSIPAVLVLLVSMGLAYGLPPVYLSTATVLIEQQDIPRDLVRTTVTSYATERIQVISQRVLTRENLWEIIEKYNLYADRNLTDDRVQILSRMRERIGINMISAEVSDPTTGRSGRAAIAFELSFESDDPLAAQQVTNELVSLYLKENLRIRAQMASDTSEFLSEEARKLSEQITVLEAELAEFKERNVGQLPELRQLVMSQMERTERELEDTHRSITGIKEREQFLVTQLAQLEPNTGDSPAGRLRALQVRYMSASASYSPNHPDVIGLRREIEALRQRLGHGDSIRDIETQVLETRASLNELRDRYSDSHPDVVRLANTLTILNDELSKVRSDGDSVVTNHFEPDNPAYVATRTQLEAVRISLRDTEDRRDRLRENLSLYENRIMQMPRVEQEGLIIRRDYDNSVRKFHEIKQKELEALLAEQLEMDERGERFSLIEPALAPGKPHKPNRLGILMLGMVFSMAGGFGVASASEFLDRTIRGANNVLALTGAPPLVTIPYITNAEDKHKKNRWIVIIGITALSLLALGLVAAQVFMKQ